MMFEAEVGVKAGRPTHGGPAVTIAAPASGETSAGQLEEDEFHMLWLVHRNRRNAGECRSCSRLRSWRIVNASPEEQALLDGHEFGSGTIQ
jgi:hypothetical protein